MFRLNSKYKPAGDQPEAIRLITANFKQSKNEQVLLGVTGSGKTFSVANIIEKLGKKTLVLAHNKTLAAQLYGELKDFFPDNAVEYFISYYDYYRPEAYIPGKDVYIEKDASINDEIDKLRHHATQSLLERDDVIVVASVSCIYGIGSPEEYQSFKMTIFEGDEIDRTLLLRNLVEIQYKRNDTDLSRGMFRVRGELVDIFPANEDSNLIRLEFFGDRIDTISLVDPLTNVTSKRVKKITIYPSSHYVVGKEKMDRAYVTIKEELRSRLAQFESEGKLLERERLEKRTLYDLEMMEEVGVCSGIENYSRHLTGALPGDPPPTLIDFFGNDFLLVVDESHVTLSQVRGMYAGDRSRKENLVEHGFRLPSALDNRPLNFSEFESKYRKVLYLSATPGDYELARAKGEIVEQLIRPTGLVDPVVEVRPADGQVKDFLNEIKISVKKNQRVLVTTLTKKLAEELTSYFSQEGINVKYLHSDIDAIERVEIIQGLRKKEFDVLVGINLLREGLDIPEVALIGIFDADKEGFLRSTRSLIQTIGRASRNVDGRVILYAYKETKSMREATSETNRRRIIQEEFNKKHGITPKSIMKEIGGGIIETLKRAKKSGPRSKNSVSELTTESIDAQILQLKKRMKEESKGLCFEEAAKIRDEIKSLIEARILL